MTARGGQGDRRALERRRAQVGGKAASLEAARTAGMSVPPFFVLEPAEASSPDRQTLIAALDELGPGAMAVRSSAIAEDGEASFAGQLESVIGVEGVDAVLHAIGEVGSSATTGRAKTYGDRLASSPGSVAVIVQRLVDSEWAGVAFCRDPLTFQPEIVIESVRGQGGALVGGTVTPARCSLHPETLEFLVPPDHELSPPPADVLRAVAALARQAETIFGKAQDIEWASDGRELWLLQSRPMTALDGLDLYSDTFSAEVWPGLIKPLVFSVGDLAVNNAWGRLLTTVVGPMDVEWSRMAGLAASRAYFNESLLGSVLAHGGLPDNMLESLSRGQRPRLREGSLLRQVLSASRLVLFLVRNRRWLSILDRELPRLRARADSLGTGIEQLDPESLRERFSELVDLLEDSAYFSVVTMIAMQLRGQLAKAAAKSLGVDTDALKAPSDSDIGPLGELTDIAWLLRRLPETVRASLGEDDLPQMLATLSRTAEGREAVDAMELLLERWGHVATVNTDFSAMTWNDDPLLLWRLASRMDPVEHEVEPVSATDGGGLARGIRGRVVARRVEVLRAYVKARDEVNDVLALVYDGLRRSSRRAGELLAPEHLATPDQVFFLHLDELYALLGGGSGPAVAELSRRSDELQADSDIRPPHRLWGLRLPPRWRMLGGERPATAADGVLHGIPGSAGISEGIARIVTDLTEVPPLGRDDILVVPHADVGWTPLFGVIGGVVAATGGSLSHAAIVAREVGVPAVLDVADATLIIPEGARIQVNGSEGVVRILDPAPNGAECFTDEGETSCAT